MSPLVHWANEWFVQPSSLKKPTSDRAWLFAAVVDLICSGTSSRKELKIVHNIFTYLLRGCNPITAWVNPSCVDKPASISGNGFFTEEYLDSVCALMDFEHEPDKSSSYALLSHLSRSVTDGGVGQRTTFEEEQKSLMVLSAWLVGRPRKITVPNDVVTVRACLDLYHRHKMKSWSSLEEEYVGLNMQLGYLLWLNRHTTRILSTDKDSKTAMNEIAYLAIFACLVRACRMTASYSENRSWMGDHLTELLETQVKQMYHYLDDYPMVVELSKRPFNRVMSVFGIVPKKKLKR